MDERRSPALAGSPLVGRPGKRTDHERHAKQHFEVHADGGQWLQKPTVERKPT